ncbi:MAG TPA: hypothetical protein VJX29_02845 [Candidatus Acidoferrales bacterium]|nr:hypothetical protein [Candidatus Acidoferrales bacterium]
MPAPEKPPQNSETGDLRPEDLGHPRGTLVIVTIFGLAFGLAWFAMYVFEFLRRGAPHS